jgi:hypothetical protein
MVDPKIAAERLRRENGREAEALAARRLRAQQLGHHLAERLLAAYPMARKVWGFGSTFETWRSYRMKSDIDLAVEQGDILTLMRLVEGEEIEVDLVDLSSCHGSMAAFIRAQGIVLAEAQE